MAKKGSILGAVGGASAGSALGPLGAVGGGIIGGLLGGLFGKKSSKKQHAKDKARHRARRAAKKAQMAALMAPPAVEGGEDEGGESLEQYFARLSALSPETDAEIAAGGYGMTPEEIARLKGEADTQTDLDVNKATTRTKESANARGVLASGFQTGTERRLQEAGNTDKSAARSAIDQYDKEMKRANLDAARNRKMSLISGGMDLSSAAANRDLSRGLQGAEFAFQGGQRQLDRLFQDKMYSRERAANKKNSRNQLWAGLGQGLIGAGNLGANLGWKPFA